MASNQAQKPARQPARQSFGAGGRPPLPVYVATTIVIFFLFLSAADSIGLVPCHVDGSTPCGADTFALSNLPELGDLSQTESTTLTTSGTVVTVLPERIVIPEVNIDLPVQNPVTRDIPTLDEYLKDGPVRYVDSARLGEKGDVLLFAHPSHLPVVKNQMYKAFNRVPELSPGDTITVQGEGRSYVYSVKSVRKANAEDAIIDLSPTLGKKLTLVTCDTLTSKSSRFILEADFVAVI